MKSFIAVAMLTGMASFTTAYAGTITVTNGGSSIDVTATSAAGATTSPFPLANFGNAGTNGLVSTAPIFLQNGLITFGPNTTMPSAGLYDGSVTGVATSAFSGTGFKPANYLVAEPNNAVTISYTAPQSTFSLLWGTVDAYNSLTVSFLSGGVATGSVTVTGTNVAAASGGTVTTAGSNPAFVTLANYMVAGTAMQFDTIRITSSTAAFEFVPSVTVPEPASLGLLGLAVAGVGMVRRRRRAFV